METPRENGDKPTVEIRGPACYENWKAALAGRAFPGAYEVPLYTDAYITGELEEGYGPYRLINVGAPLRRGLARPAIVLRAEAQVIFDTNEMLRQLDGLPRGTKSKRNHGGGPDDEVTALFSLSLGIRLKPGDRLREFVPDGDPKGRPLPGLRGEPVLLRNAGRPVIPRAVRKQSLNDDVLVECLPLLDPDDAFAVVRAARLYQDALWIAESEPALAWLMFVSAVETAANHWRSTKDPPRSRLRASNPELEKLLLKVGGEEHGDKVAKMIVGFLGSTKKFVDFVLEFRPEPPDQRPSEWARAPWDPTGIRKSMRVIYEHRSRALHDGTPFPAPMCEPPWIGEGMPAPVECPRGVMLPTLGVKWDDDDVPMCLHTFEYIVQGALCKWWESMVKERDTAEGPSTLLRMNACAT